MKIFYSILLLAFILLSRSLEVHSFQVNSTGCLSSSCLLADNYEERFSLLEERVDLLENLVFPASCANIYGTNADNGDGDYYVYRKNSEGIYEASTVYCDMTNGGFERTMYFMYNETNCFPNTRSEVEYGGAGYTCCRKELAGCLFLAQVEVPYRVRSVRGNVVGFQFGTLDAFGNGAIGTSYVDGFSFTALYEGTRTHLWSYAVGYGTCSDLETCSLRSALAAMCPCEANGGGSAPPAFVGSQYYCDTNFYQVNTTAARDSTRHLFSPEAREDCYEGQGVGDCGAVLGLVLGFRVGKGEIPTLPDSSFTPG
eukprot:GCRY01002271.1.p1 GENE.GCRY01002271.1~~GCRY01002271.1.p1  ORF type:complete len:312 (+),score=36.85 GCRY01002271.1:131-1066(+)